MRKEVSIAIIVGIILGAVILYGINLANQSTISLPKPTPTPTPIQITPSTNNNDATKSSVLTINTYTNNQVVFDKDITITGKADPNAKISIIWESDETIISSDDKGNFTQKISLIPGENNIQIDEVTPNNTLISSSLKLFYSSKTIE